MVTDTATRIDLPLVETLHRRDVTVKECYLLLHKEYLEYKTSATYEADDFHDKEGIWAECSTNYRWTRLKRDLTQVDMYYDNPEGKWMVSIEFNGISGSTGWLFETPKEALRIYNRLQDYFLGTVIVLSE